MLIETLPAAFQMDEILYELREHSYGLNAGRWDYIFSMIKVFRDDPDFVLPDRNDVKMTVPFMRAYTELLVKTCHARGAFAMGGMAALIPSRKDEEANQRAIDAVKADKEREAKAGFDGTWVAHPDVVDVALAAFDEVLGDRPNQIDQQRDDVDVDAEQLLDAASTPGEITEEGLRSDVNVGFQYISFWLGGRGAAGINNLMEDAATAEISRSQIWQWIRHGKFDAASTCARSSTRRWSGSAPRSATRCGRRAARTRRARSSSGWRSPTTSRSSSRCRRTSTSTERAGKVRTPPTRLRRAATAEVAAAAESPPPEVPPPKSPAGVRPQAPPQRRPDQQCRAGRRPPKKPPMNGANAGPAAQYGIALAADGDLARLGLLAALDALGVGLAGGDRRAARRRPAPTRRRGVDGPWRGSKKHGGAALRRLAAVEPRAGATLIAQRPSSSAAPTGSRSSGRRAELATRWSARS